MRVSTFVPHSPGARSAKKARDVADFLRAHDKMSALLPAVMRMAGLQKDCTAILPAMFEFCSVLHMDAGQLTLAMPNAALAAKLKQQLPKLQEGLLRRGWQVNAIRLKVQVAQPVEKAAASKRITLPQQAVSALSELGNALENSPRNDVLKAAIHAMVQRHRKSE